MQFQQSSKKRHSLNQEQMNFQNSLRRSYRESIQPNKNLTRRSVSQEEDILINQLKRHVQSIQEGNIIRSNQNIDMLFTDKSNPLRKHIQFQLYTPEEKTHIGRNILQQPQIWILLLIYFDLVNQVENPFNIKQKYDITNRMKKYLDDFQIEEINMKIEAYRTLTKPQPLKKWGSSLQQSFRIMNATNFECQEYAENSINSQQSIQNQQRRKSLEHQFTFQDNQYDQHLTDNQISDFSQNFNHQVDSNQSQINLQQENMDASGKVEEVEGPEKIRQDDSPKSQKIQQSQYQSPNFDNIHKNEPTKEYKLKNTEQSYQSPQQPELQNEEPALKECVEESLKKDSFVSMSKLQNQDEQNSIVQNSTSQSSLQQQYQEEKEGSVNSHLDNQFLESIKESEQNKIPQEDYLNDVDHSGQENIEQQSNQLELQLNSNHHAQENQIVSEQHFVDSNKEDQFQTPDLSREEEMIIQNNNNPQQQGLQKNSLLTSINSSPQQIMIAPPNSINERSLNDQTSQQQQQQQQQQYSLQFDEQINQFADHNSCNILVKENVEIIEEMPLNKDETHSHKNLSKNSEQQQNQNKQYLDDSQYQEKQRYQDPIYSVCDSVQNQYPESEQQLDFIDQEERIQNALFANTTDIINDVDNQVNQQEIPTEYYKIEELSNQIKELQQLKNETDHFQNHVIIEEISDQPEKNEEYIQSNNIIEEFDQNNRNLMVEQTQEQKQEHPTKQLKDNNNNTKLLDQDQQLSIQEQQIIVEEQQQSVKKAQSSNRRQSTANKKRKVSLVSQQVSEIKQKNNASARRKKESQDLLQNVDSMELKNCGSGVRYCVMKASQEIFQIYGVKEVLVPRRSSRRFSQSPQHYDLSQYIIIDNEIANSYEPADENAQQIQKDVANMNLRHTPLNPRANHKKNEIMRLYGDEIEYYKECVKIDIIETNLNDNDSHLIGKILNEDSELFEQIALVQYRKSESHQIYLEDLQYYCNKLIYYYMEQPAVYVPFACYDKQIDQ